MGVSSPQVAPINSCSDHKHLQGIILNGITAHLVSSCHFTRDFDQFKSTSISQLYQPLEDLYYKTATTDCFQKFNRKHLLRDIPKNRY